MKLECENRLGGVIIDWFGTDMQLMRSDPEHFVVYVNVAVSSQFLDWVIGLGRGVKVIEPESVVDIIKARGVTIAGAISI